MKEINSEELKQIQIGLINEFDKICRENNLKYSAGGGTLLGAVRHKGFIPWDDDVDVVMPRDDYEKLLNLKFENENFAVMSHRYCRNYYYSFAKLIDKKTLLLEKNRPEKTMGVYIDIFPLDYVEKNDDKFQKDMKKELKMRKFLDHLTSNPVSNGSKDYKFIFKKFVHFFSDPFRKAILNSVDKKHIQKSGKYCINFVYNFRGSKQLVESKIWDELEYLDFEDTKILCFKDYDTFLSALYGDYMMLPPKEKQIAHHSFEAYFK
ncbi:MAG: phosphorylcholine transferase LicD [Eubacterium sp.]